jgi:hypothetical protein
MPNSGDPIRAVDGAAASQSSNLAPIVRLIAVATQSIPNNTRTGLLFAAGSEDIDTDNYHDTTTNPSRITPTLAGYYEYVCTYITGGRTDYTVIDVCLAKNGVAVAPDDRRAFSTAATQVSNACTVEAKGYISCNGTGDFFEVSAFQQNAAAVAQLSNQSVQFSSTFQMKFLRPF